MIRIFHASDLHFGLEDGAAIDWFAEAVRRERPDAVVITGDLTMRARGREFDAAARWIGSLAAPVMVGAGNHDLPYFNPLARLFWPYRRAQRVAAAARAAVKLPGIAIIPLNTTARAQWRFDWSKGRVSARALNETLAAIDALPPATRVLVMAHHPLVEAGTSGRALTRGGQAALTALAGRGVTAVLSGHVHDAFDLMRDTDAGTIRMIGAGTLSQRVRSTPPSFNELTISAGGLDVRVRNMEHVATPDMQIDNIPPDALPPRGANDAVAPIAAVPPVDPPIH